MSIKDMPCVTVEQVLALREAAIKLETENTQLKDENWTLKHLAPSTDDLNKIKADAVRGSLDECAWWYDKEFIKIDEILEYADKLERGEV